MSILFFSFLATCLVFIVGAALAMMFGVADMKPDEYEASSHISNNDR